MTIKDKIQFNVQYTDEKAKEIKKKLDKLPQGFTYPIIFERGLDSLLGMVNKTRNTVHDFIKL